MSRHAFAFLVAAETDRELSPSDLDYLRDLLAPHLLGAIKVANIHTHPVVKFTLHACPSREVLAPTLQTGSATEAGDAADTAP